MGFIWNVILSFDNEELWEDGEDEARETCEPLERINAWIRDGRLVSLVGPTYDDEAGCGMDANLYGGGFKHFEIEGLIDAATQGVPQPTPPPQGGRVAKRQEAASSINSNGSAATARVVKRTFLGQLNPNGAASCRFATRPVLRTRSGHPKNSVPAPFQWMRPSGTA